jgi:hypothetical protein
VDVGGGDRAPVLPEEGQVGRERANERQEKSKLYGHQEGIGRGKRIGRGERRTVSVGVFLDFGAVPFELYGMG